MIQPKATNYGAAGFFNGYFLPTDRLKLFNATFTPTLLTTLADLQAAEVAFSGYGAYIMSGSWQFGVDVDGNPTAIYTSLANFQQSNISVNDVAGGWWIEDQAGGSAKLVNPFDAPVIFDTTGTTLLVKPSWILEFNSHADIEVVFGV